jgi:SAM-dependent methyltransferase
MDTIAYLDEAATAAVHIALDYKRRLLELLDLRPGHRVADLGCGPGTDLAALAAVVAPGTVTGIDHDPVMVAEASRRVPSADVRVADLHALPLADGSLDRARTDRVLQHVVDPAAAVAEAFRVLRPGGVLGMAEPDWDTLAVADDDVETSRGFARFTAGRVRNATIGRDLVRLVTRAGFQVRDVQAVPVVFREAVQADRILGLTRNTARAVEAGRLRDEVAGPWLSRLMTAPFLASFTLYLITATHP